MTLALCTFPNVLGTPDALYGNDTTQNIDLILPLQDGLRIIHNFDTKVITRQWTVLVTLDTPVVPTDFFDFVSKLRSRLVAPAVAMSMSFRDECERRLNQAENMITQPQDWYSHSTGTKRSKRGIFNLVGHALQFLFGTAQESEVRDARYRIKNNETVSERLIKDVNSLTVIINSAYDHMLENRKRIILLTTKFTEAFKLLNKQINSLHSTVRVIYWEGNIDKAITQLELYCRDYLRLYDSWLRKRQHMEAGHLNEHLLSRTELLSILASSPNFDAQPVTPIEWYYENVIITPLWMSDQRVYKTVLPLVPGTDWHHYRVQQFPVPVAGYYAMLDLPEIVLRNTYTSQITLHPECLGYTNYVCPVPELFSEKDFPCISNLLADQPTYHDSCQLNRSHYPQAFTSALVGSVVMDEMEVNSNQKDVIYHIHYNEYVLLTSGVTVKLVCHDKPSHNVALKGGVYHIELSHPCRLIGDGWLLIATFTMMGNLTLPPRCSSCSFTKSDFN